MNSLVTGGAGFIGSHVADRLLNMGHRVVVLDDLSGGYRNNVSPAAHFVRGTIVNSSLVDKLCEEYKFDYIFHLAAYAAEGLSHFIRKFNYTNNLIGSANLINAAVKHEVKCFVFTSSMAVYGAAQTPFSENMKPDPEDPYGIAKYAVEMDLRAAHEMWGLDYIIFRPHNVYGERQNIADHYRNVIGIFMNQIMQGRSCTVFGDGSQTRAFSYIGDMAPVIADSINHPSVYNKIFNIGSDATYTVQQLAEKVQQTMMQDTGIDYLPPRKEVRHAFSSHDRLLQYFGNGAKARTTLDEGLFKMFNWVKKVGPMRGESFNGIEVEKNLPPKWKELINCHPTETY